MTVLRISAAVALTSVLITSPIWGREEDKARKVNGASSQGRITDTAITQNQNGLAGHRDSASSAGGGSSDLPPFDALLKGAFYGEGAAGQGEAGGAMVRPHTHKPWVASPPWPTTQGHRRVTGRHLRRPPYTVGDQERIRTTFYPNGVRETVVRDIFGRPLYWSVEERSGHPTRLYVPR